MVLFYCLKTMTTAIYLTYGAERLLITARRLKDNSLDIAQGGLHDCQNCDVTCK
ncbi:hypothetical protein BDY19DRAFT_949195 [Irpex rosettiformis]|uniref:Uncharacterized protein n=1 Tax=Irpex rosettiformis TaxID=378272 RepID=A0ACB8U2Y0_9APHY|nr:hypothetical protein BDY19DRAFT_949195 [Irpex rosettiformis]